jgi:GWxTD domain-containing protein
VIKPKQFLSISLALLACLTVPTFSQEVSHVETIAKGQGDNYYQLWLDQDVRWIITDEERRAFGMLKNDEERDRFIEAFWERRNPKPDELENAFEQEHYRRIVYSNDHFSSANVPGWETDRGRIYVVYGPPNEMESDAKDLKAEFPKETWRYRYIDGLGKDVKIEFIDSCKCGDYRLDAQAEDALFHNPERDPNPQEMKELKSNPGRLISVVAGVPSPHTRFKDLEEIVLHHFSYNLLPFEVATTFQKATDATTLAQIVITVNDANIKFADNGAKLSGKVNMFARIVRLDGGIANEFENTLDLNLTPEGLSDLPNHSSSFQNTVPLRPGNYRLEIAAKDVNGDKTGTLNREFTVPR